MKTKIIVLIITLTVPEFLAARFQRFPQNQLRQEPAPIKNYGMPTAPQIPAKIPMRPPAQRPPHLIKPKPPKPIMPPKPLPPKPKPPKPPRLPYYTGTPYLYQFPVMTVYCGGVPIQYTYAWYKDRYVILYNGWFWYNNEWVWGGRGTAPLPPAWRPE